MSADRRRIRFQALIDQTSVALSEGKAHELLEKAVSLLADVLSEEILEDLRVSDLQYFDWLAELSFHLGKDEASRNLLSAVELSCRQVGNIEGADGAGLRIALSLMVSGQLTSALNKLRQVQPGLVAIDEMLLSGIDTEALIDWENRLHWRQLELGQFNYLTSRFYLIYSTYLVNTGRYIDAQTFADRARQILSDYYSPNKMDPVQIPLDLLRAQARLESGEFEQAQTILEQIKSGSNMPEVDRLRYSELDGRLAYYSGDLQRAKKSFDDVCVLAKSHGFDSSWLRASLNRVSILILLNQTNLAEEALSHLAQLERVQGSAEISHDIAALERQIRERRSSWSSTVFTSVSASKRKTDPAFEYPSFSPESDVDESGDGRSSSPFVELERKVPRILSFLKQQGRLSLSADAHWAKTELKRLKERFQQCDSPFMQARLKMIEGWTHTSIGEKQQARLCLQGAAISFQKMGAYVDLRMALDTLSSVDNGALDARSDGAFELPSHDDITAHLSDSLTSEERAIYLLDKATSEERALLDEIFTLLDKQRAVAKASWFSRRSVKGDLTKHVLGFCDKLDTKRAFLNEDLPPLELKSFLAKELTILFLSFSDRLIVALLNKRQAEFVQLPITRLDLRDRIAAWHESVARVQRAEAENTHNSPEQITAIHESEAIFLEEEEQINSLFEDIGLPAFVKTRRAKRIRIIADDVLHGAPLCAALVGRKRLIEKCEIVYDTQIRPRVGKKQRDRNPIAAFVGATRAAIFQNRSYPSLEGVKAEGEAFARALKRVGASPCLLTDVERPFTKQEVIRELERAAVSSIACHGAYSGASLSLSGLLLPKEHEESDVLSLIDIGDLNLSNMTHITLMACWSADAYVVPGQRILSLPQAILRSGAGSVLGSFWELRDDVAPIVTERFFKLARKRGRAAALRRIQIDAIHGRLPGIGADQKRTDNWACLALYGEAGRLKI